jgi:hypothetical protein
MLTLETFIIDFGLSEDSGNLSREFSYPGNPIQGSDFGYLVRKIPISVPDPIFPPKYRKRIMIETGDYFILNQQKNAHFLVYNMWGYGKISFPTFRTPMVDFFGKTPFLP